MPRGTPDGRIQDALFAGQVTDLAYVNNMLWGFSPIDNQGRVMYFETFNNGMSGVKTSVSGAAATPSITSTVYAFSPPQAVLMNPGVVNNDLCQVYRELYAGKSLRIGLECGWTFGNITPNPRLAVDYNPISFATSYFGSMIFSRALSSWQIGLPGGTFQTFFTPGVPGVNTAMNLQAKIVMDFATGKYVRALIGDQDFDLSAYSMPSSVISYNGQLIASFRVTSFGAGTGSTNLGYILITKDEP